MDNFEQEKENHSVEITDDDLELVSAAGDGFLMNHVYPLEQLEAERAASARAAVPGINLPPEERL